MRRRTSLAPNHDPTVDETPTTLLNADPLGQRERVVASRDGRKRSEHRSATCSNARSAATSPIAGHKYVRSFKRFGILNRSPFRSTRMRDRFSACSTAQRLPSSRTLGAHRIARFETQRKRLPGRQKSRARRARARGTARPNDGDAALRRDHMLDERTDALCDFAQRPGGTADNPRMPMYCAQPP